jgi:hypothetical protein
MLSAVLLLAGWVRELSWWAENHPEVFQPFDLWQESSIPSDG